MTLPATIYARFSNQEQSQGNGKDRQLTLCREMIARHKWQGSTDREKIDEGVSAYSGANRAPGGLLHQFEQEAEIGLYRDGHVLVTENLDRISRQGYDAVLPFLQRLTSQGVTVATVDGDRVYPAYERVTMASVIEAVVKSELSREESEKKSRRLRAAQNKRVSAAQANAGEMLSHTASLPAWITATRISPLADRPLYRMGLNEKRAALVREIFQLTIDGYGTPAIARMLNERNEPVWSNLGKKSKHGWTVGYLTKIVMNRAVIGEYHPKNSPRYGKETSKGIAILNHFPAAVDAVMFARAHVARQGRKGTSGAWQITHGNLFSGIAQCGVCGGRMKQERSVLAGGKRKDSKSKLYYPSHSTISYLKCDAALNRVREEGTGKLRCSNRNWVRYEYLEAAVVEFAAGWLALHRQGAPSADVSAIQIEIADAQRFLADKQTQADNAAISFVNTKSPTMERLMLQLDQEVIDRKKEIEQLERKLAVASSSVPAGDFLAHIETQKALVNSDNQEERNKARVAMKQTLRGLIKRMECDEERNTHVVVGDNALRFSFDAAGNLIGTDEGQNVIRLGPNGEIDWHPDYPDADYEIHHSAI